MANDNSTLIKWASVITATTITAGISILLLCASHLVNSNDEINVADKQLLIGVLLITINKILENLYEPTRNQISQSLSSWSILNSNNRIDDIASVPDDDIDVDSTSEISSRMTV